MYSRNAVRNDNYDYYRYDDAYYNSPVLPTKHKRIVAKNRAVNKIKKKNNIIGKAVAFIILAIIGYCFIPTAYNMFKANFIKVTVNNTEESNNLFSSRFEVKGGLNYGELLNPTLSYLSNYTFLNSRVPYDSLNAKKAKMAKLEYGERLDDLELRLKSLSNKYSLIKPSIFVMSVDNHSWASIDSNKVYPAASIIKLPVLIQLYKSIELEQFGLKDSMYLTEYYRSSGSGDLQYSQAGNRYSIYDLARVMIQDSDNTATNMLMSKLGSMNDINAALKNWGIKHTHVQTWLPDLTGTNYTTAEDMAQMLYNISDDNNSFLNVNSQSDIINIMGKVKNVNLIKAGLPSGVDFIHKTGDIGTMLGDAGIVYLPSGQRYIVVILALRPHNHPDGKTFIQEASKIIYNYMSSKYN